MKKERQRKIMVQETGPMQPPPLLCEELSSSSRSYSSSMSASRIRKRQLEEQRSSPRMTISPPSTLDDGRNVHSVSPPPLEEDVDITVELKPIDIPETSSMTDVVSRRSYSAQWDGGSTGQDGDDDFSDNSADFALHSLDGLEGFCDPFESDEPTRPSIIHEGRKSGNSQKKRDDEVTATTLTNTTQTMGWSNKHRGNRGPRTSGSSVATDNSNSSVNNCGSRAVDTVSFRSMTPQKQLQFSINRLRTALSKTSHMVGRESEVHEIEQAFEYVSNKQQTAVVWITGASGSGKSYLANRLNAVQHSYQQYRPRRQQQGKSRRRRRSSTSDASTISSSISGATQPKKPKRGRFFFSVNSKFDLQFVNEPFACIKYALTDLTNQIMTLPRKKKMRKREDKGADSAHESDSSTGSFTASSGSESNQYYYYFDDLQQQLRMGLGEDLLRLLSKFIPNLVDIVDFNAAMSESQQQRDDGVHGKADNDSRISTKKAECSNNPTEGDSDDKMLWLKQNTSGQSSGGYKELSDRTKFAFQKFVQTVTAFCPLVWVADDLQWADQASLEMIRSWIMDVRITSFMVIGCYRCNDQKSKTKTKTTNIDTNGGDKVEDGTKTGNDDILHEMIQAIQDVHEERKIKINDIYVDNLPLEHVNELLSRSLSTPGEKTYSLAKVVHGKTHGNFFFTIQLLLNLAQQNLLRFDLETLKWEWEDENDIHALTLASANVVELMQTKVTEIPEVTFSLPLAACLGAVFQWSTLKVVLDGFQKDDEGWRLYHTSIFGSQNNDDRQGEDKDHRQTLSEPHAVYTQEIMGICVEQGLLEPRGKPGETYCFVHDKVQEVARSLIPDDKLSEIQYRIGDILFKDLPKQELDQNCFLVANLINPRLDLNGSALDDTQRQNLVFLNYLAGSKAVSQSAFLSALAYFGTAIDLLPTNHWSDHRAVSLDLYSSAAECAHVVGDFEKTKFYSSQVLDLNDHHLTAMEKIRAYHVMIDFHMNESNSEARATEALKVGLEALKELGCSFPKSSLMLGLSTLKGLLKAKKNAQTKWTEDVIENLPITTDPKATATARTLAKFMLVAYFGKPELLPLVIIKNIKLAFEKGVTVHSPPSFATLGLIVGSVMGDFQTGEKLALHGLRLVARFQNISRVAEAETLSVSYTTILHWTKPFQSCRVPCLESYQIGMRVGDTTSAMWSAAYYFEFAIGCAASLALVEAEALSFFKAADDCGCTVQRDCIGIQRQVSLNLQGKSPNTTILTGYDFDEEEMLNRYIQSNHLNMQMVVHRNKVTVMVFFGAFKEGAELVLKYGDQILERLMGQTGCLYTVFYGGLCCYVASRLSKSSSSANGEKKHRQQLLKKAKGYRQKLKSWVKKGCPNCHHMVALLDAEHLISMGKRKKEKEIIKAYQDSIAFAGRKGLVQDQALASERMAEYYLHRSQQQITRKQQRSPDAINVMDGNVDDDDEIDQAIDHIDEAMYRFGEAKRLYWGWGANAVVERVEKRCESLLER